MRDSPPPKRPSACLSHPLALYLGSIAALTVLPTAGLLIAAREHGAAIWLLALVAILLLLCASQAAVALVNVVTTRLATPRALPKMDLSAGIPPAARTLVVVPTLITSAHNVQSLVEALEVRFLGNRDDHLSFGLLTDLADAAQEALPEDEPLVRLAERLINELNDKYRTGSFFLFHRPRRWNPRERIWMGYERKRGKLADLNALLRGAGPGRFSCIVGDTRVTFLLLPALVTALPGMVRKPGDVRLAHHPAPASIRLDSRRRKRC